MNKLHIFVIGCSLGFAILLAILLARSNHTETPQNSTANLLTFDWELAGIDFRYPATWTVLSWASSSEMTSHLELISSSDGTPKDQPYFCVDLFINPPSSDFYQLRNGGILARTGNGFVIYRRFLSTGGLKNLQAWLTNDQLASVLPLANGKILFAEVSYRCLSGDADVPTLTAGQQQSSSYFTQSLSILESVASAVPSIRG